LSVPPPPQAHPLPLECLRKVVKGILERVQNLTEAVRTIEWRVRAGSLLIIYEGDETALERALRTVPPLSTCPASPSSPAADSIFLPPARSFEQPLLAFDVRLIDFAHTRSALGEGADEGLLLGLQTVVSLLEGWLREYTLPA